MKLLLDMNLSPRWARFLGDAGFQAVHWAELGARDATDVEIMAYAGANGLVVLTHDLDFAAILAATSGTRPSVVQIRSDEVSPELIGRQVITALRQMAVELEAGALLSVDPGRTRLRILPLRPGLAPAQGM